MVVMQRRSILKQMVALPAAAAVGACAKSSTTAVEKPSAPAPAVPVAKEPLVNDVTGRQGRWPVKSLTSYTAKEAETFVALPKAPHLIDFLRHRFLLAQHLFYSARWAMQQGLPEPVVIATLCHDMGQSIARPDHAYWSAMLVRPYVSDEVAWTIEAHQSLRFYPDESCGYRGAPAFYKQYFGADAKPDPYIEDQYTHARRHKWYMNARLVTMADQETPEPKELYVDSPHEQLDPAIFTDLIGRNFKMPKEGLGFDNSSVAHMWRTLIFPTRML